MYRELPDEKQRTIRHDLWPSRVGIAILVAAISGYWWWGKWPTFGLDMLALAFILVTGARVLPRVNEMLAPRNPEIPDSKPGEK